MYLRLLLSTAALALTAGVAHAEYTLHILHINDLHSRIEPINKFDSTCSAEDAAKGECFGGYARVATKIRELRNSLKAAGENVIVVDAGDQFQGSLFYTTYKGATEAEFMEKISFDVMAVGNHEFDDGPEGLAAFIDQVTFPVISGNLDLSGNNALNGKVKNHVVLEVGGQKIGVISALATDTAQISSPGPSIAFRAEADSLAADVVTLQAEGVNKIIAVNHVGLPMDLEIGKSVAGIDAIVSAHSHTLLSNTAEKPAGPYPTMAGETPVVQAYAYGKYLGHLTLVFDDAGKVTSATGDTIVIDASVQPDAEIVARIKELGAPIEELKAKVIGESAADIDGSRETCRAVECAMGNLVADAMLDRVKDQGITIAIQNGGGVRASIDAGPITMDEVLTVLPFQNTLSTFRIAGADIVAALENGVSEVEEGKGKFPQVAGLKFTWDESVAAGQGRVSEVLVKDGGDWRPIDPAKEYGVVTNNFVRSGGDGYDMFAAKASQAYDFGPGLEQVVADYIAAKGGKYEPYTDGRIAKK